MKKVIFVFFGLFISFYVNAQIIDENNPGKENSHPNLLYNPADKVEKQYLLYTRPHPADIEREMAFQKADVEKQGKELKELLKVLEERRKALEERDESFNARAEDTESQEPEYALSE
ncbi:hypothetical protein FACS189485_20130 [Spirochaetia bacterium]|nr:hypothetical protein FACS189485_20130 [Spirochaetia bacterium]